MIQYLFSITKEHLDRAKSKSKKRVSDCTLRFEFLEARYVFSGVSPLIVEGWQSAVFDDGVTGTLPVQFTRNTETVEPDGDLVAVNSPRYGDERLLNSVDTWDVAYQNAANFEILGSGLDLDGATPLAILLNRNTNQVQFLRGDDFAVVNAFQLSVNGGDIMRGTVQGYKYLPQHAIIYEGLVVVMCERQRREGNQYIPEGVSFAYTQDYGQTFTRVEQVGGGFDVPAIPGGVTDGMGRSRSWSFANAFPEKSADDRLGVWFPWADYLQQTGNPHGGQIGLFRARRTEVGAQWVVEPDRLVYETWRLDDSGGFHAHTAGMFVDGMVSFWGDVSYRNRVVRHVAADLENYTTTTWTHEEEFEGGWSPSNAPVSRLGTQSVAAAPGTEFGDILVAGDEQAESILKVERPDHLGDKAIVTSLRGSFPGLPSGSSYAGRLTLWLQNVPGMGYIAKESSSQVGNEDALYYSVDGETWGSLLNLGSGEPYIYGKHVITVYEDKLYVLDLPKGSAPAAPLLLNPGGLNLATVDWSQIQAPAAGNSIRRVLYQNDQYVYADNGQPLSVQPEGPPPVVNGMPLYEVISDGTNRAIGVWDATGSVSSGNKLHWLDAWHYSLDGNGISPQFRIGNAVGSEKESVWYANSEWVPSQDYIVPSPTSTVDAEQQIRLFSGKEVAPRHWLMAIQGFSQSAAPTYPLGPDQFGNNELASVMVPQTVTTSWSTALTFGLPQLSSFSSYFDANGDGTVHTIASIYKSNLEHIDITFTKTAAAAGVLSIDVYSGGVLLDKMSFKSIYWEREDQVRLVISNSPSELGVSMLVTRNGYGMDSKSLTTSGTNFVPKEIRLSNAARTEVAPLEWFAVQFNPTQALTTSERQGFIASTKMFKTLDVAAPLGPLGFDADEDMDGRDFLIWQRGYGIQDNAVREDGDANADGRVDGLDLAVWQSAYGLTGEPGPITGDFNLDGVIDDLDLVIWHEGYGITRTNNVREQGDANGDGNVDGRDFLVWQRQYTGPVEEIADIGAVVATSNSIDDSSNLTVAELHVDDSSVSSSLQSLKQGSQVGEPHLQSVEQGSNKTGETVNFWLTLLPVGNTESRQTYRSNAVIDQHFELRGDWDDRKKRFDSGPKSELPTNHSVRMGNCEQASSQDDSGWTDTSDLAIEDWQIL